MLSAELWKSEKSFKILKDEESLDPMSGHIEKTHAHSSTFTS